MGLSHPKTISEMTKPPCKTMKIFGRSWEKTKFSCKKGCMMLCSIVDRIFSNIKNQLVIAGVPRR